MYEYGISTYLDNFIQIFTINDNLRNEPLRLYFVTYAIYLLNIMNKAIITFIYIFILRVFCFVYGSLIIQLFIETYSLSQ